MGTSKKDYIVIARILSYNKTRKDIGCALADHFERDNPRFHRGQFLRAANIQSCKGADVTPGGDYP